jgi:RNA polymerase sigma factor (sigma-70 family)
MSITKARAPDGSHWAELMASVTQQRDRESFMRIYDHFAPRVRLYLKGLGLPEGQAEELAQETLLRLWQRAAQYDPARGALSTWLFRVARNLHIDRKRREPQWASIEEEADLAGDLEDTVSLRLSTVQARVIRMSYFEAKTHSEIAHELGMPLGTVKSHLRRAFLHLQQGVQEAP